MSLIGYLFYLANIKIHPIANTDEEIFICGTYYIDPDSSYNLSDNGQKGKQLFNANCAACHKMDKHMVGPALRGIVSLYNDRNWEFNNYIKGKRDSLLYSTDEFIDYNCMTFPQLTEEEITNLMAYIR